MERLISFHIRLPAFGRLHLVVIFRLRIFDSCGIRCCEEGQTNATEEGHRDEIFEPAARCRNPG